MKEMEYPPMPSEWADGDYEQLACLLREVSKPLIVIANKIDIAPEESIKQLTGIEKDVLIASSQYELILRKGSERGIIQYDPGDETFEIIGEITAEQEEGLNEIGKMMERYRGTGLQNALDRIVYREMGMITVFPVENEAKWIDGRGNTLPDAYLMKNGSTPRDLAYEVHTDIGDGYLYAIDARLNRRISEDQILKDGDIIKNVSAAK